MTIDSVLADGRAAAEARMRDTCTIRRPNPAAPKTYDPESKTYTAGGTTTIYSGKCQLQMAAPESDGIPVGGDVVGEQEPILKLPIAVTGVKVGDIVTIDTAEDDAALVDKVLRVAGVLTKSQATARRLRCEEIQ